MEYSEGQKLQIGKEIYTSKISIYEAAKLYNISIYTAEDYLRLYCSKNNLDPINKEKLIVEDIESGNENQKEEDRLSTLAIDDQFIESLSKSITVKRSIIYLLLLCMVLMCIYLLYCLVCQFGIY